jgi:nucleolar protein 4
MVEIVDPLPEVV